MTTEMTEEKPKTTPLNVPPPPARQRRGLQVPVPTASEPDRPVDNLSRPNTGLQDMNFKMDIDFHRCFKIAATKRNMAMKEMLEAAFRCWVENYGDDDDKARLPPKT